MGNQSQFRDFEAFLSTHFICCKCLYENDLNFPKYKFIHIPGESFNRFYFTLICFILIMYAYIKIKEICIVKISLFKNKEHGC